MSKTIRRILIGAIVILVVVFTVRAGNNDGSSGNEEPQAPTTTEAPAPVEEEPEAPVTTEDPAVPEIVVYDELPENYVGNDAFGNGQTIGYHEGQQEICWGSDAEDAIANVLADVYPNGVDESDPREVDVAAGVTDGVLHAFYDAIEGNLVDNVDGACETLADLAVPAELIEQYEAHEIGVATPDGTYERPSREEGDGHVDDNGEDHDEDVNHAHDENRTDAYHAAEMHAYGDNEVNVTFGFVARCYGYGIAEAHAEWLATEYPNGADEQTLDGDRDGFISAFADGINEFNEGNCSEIIALYEA